MKITISLTNVPLSVTIEGPDESIADMVELASKTLFKLRETWYGALKCQMKLLEKKKKELA